VQVFNWSRGMRRSWVVRLVQLVVFVAAVVALLLGLLLTRLTVSDVFVHPGAHPHGSGDAAGGRAPAVEDSRQWWWRQVRSMGAPLRRRHWGAALLAAVLSRFPIFSTFQTRLNVQPGLQPRPRDLAAASSFQGLIPGSLSSVFATFSICL